ncbi:hypothetical protein [Singulisphaera sp. PoT]|uniref:hypothetical protein n=1 Tax=Singulisphaera sp. PoT TaxID=3411797 RepID=UPI003BF4BB4F
MQGRLGILLCRGLPILGLLALVGCGGGMLDTNYGRVRGQSVNGTGTFAELLREEGHEVRTAFRLSDELSDWSDVIVRFAPFPGPPLKEEADWYHRWLNGGAGRRLIYVPSDFVATAEYWDEVLKHLPAGTSEKRKETATKNRDEARDWYKSLPPIRKDVATPEEWFAVAATNGAPEVCKTLGGPWGEVLDAKALAITRHQTLKVDSESILLSGDDFPLAIEWMTTSDSQVLVVANGSFLLNATLLNEARIPLAMDVVYWLGTDASNVAFVEGRSVAGAGASSPSVFALLWIYPFGWVVAQLMLMGLIACLARAPRLGRARSAPTSGEDRPSAHPEALGALLARVRRPSEALVVLDAYRRWRLASNSPRKNQAPPEPLPKPESPSYE